MNILNNNINFKIELHYITGSIRLDQRLWIGFIQSYVFMQSWTCSHLAILVRPYKYWLGKEPSYDIPVAFVHMTVDLSIIKRPTIY